MQESALLSPDASLEDWISHLNSVKKEYEQGITKLNVFRESLRICCDTFKLDDRYRSDSRYLSVWLAHIKRLPQLADQLEAFVEMQSLQIGLHLANFWTERAAAFERADLIAEAYNCFHLAYYKYRSSPSFHLARSLRDFQSRIRTRKSKGHFEHRNMDETVPGRRSGYMRAYFYGDGDEFSFEELRSTLMILRVVNPDPDSSSVDHRERFQISDSEFDSESECGRERERENMQMDVDYDDSESGSGSGKDGDICEEAMDVDGASGGGGPGPGGPGALGQSYFVPPHPPHDHDGLNLNGRKRKRRSEVSSVGGLLDPRSSAFPDPKKRKIDASTSGAIPRPRGGRVQRRGHDSTTMSMSETPSGPGPGPGSESGSGSESSSLSLSGGFFIREDTIFLTPGRLKERRQQEQDALASAGVEDNGAITTDLTNLAQFRKSMGFGTGIIPADLDRNLQSETETEMQTDRGRLGVPERRVGGGEEMDLESSGEGDVAQKENRRPQKILSDGGGGGERLYDDSDPTEDTILPCPSFVAPSEVSRETAFELYRENDVCFTVVPYADAPDLFSSSQQQPTSELQLGADPPKFRFCGRMYRIHRRLEKSWFTALDVVYPSIQILVKIGATVWEYHVLNLIQRRMSDLHQQQQDQDQDQLALEDCFLRPVGFLAHQTTPEGGELRSVLVCRQPEKICWSLSCVVDTIQKNLSKRLKIEEDLTIHYSFSLLRALKFARDVLRLGFRDLNLRSVWISDSPRGILLPDLESVLDLRCSSGSVAPSGVSYARFVHQLLFKSDLNGDDSSGWSPGRIPYHFARDLWNQLFSRSLSREAVLPDDIVPLFEQYYSEHERKRRITRALHANVVSHLLRLMMKEE